MARLTETQHIVLAHIAKHGPATPDELNADLKIRGGVARTLSALQKLGLVKRPVRRFNASAAGRAALLKEGM